MRPAKPTRRQAMEAAAHFHTVQQALLERLRGTVARINEAHNDGRIDRATATYLLFEQPGELPSNAA